MECHSSVFEQNFLHPFCVFTRFASRYMFQVYSIFSRGHTASELGKPLKNLCSSYCLLSRRHFQCFRNFCSPPLQFKAKFNINMLFFDVCHFLCTPQSQEEQRTLVLHETLLPNNHTYYSLISERKWLSRLFSI